MTLPSAWATATAGLRMLLQTFTLAGYQLSNLPAIAVEQIVEGANGFVLSRVSLPDLDVLGATTAIRPVLRRRLPGDADSAADPAGRSDAGSRVQVVAVQPRFTG